MTPTLLGRWQTRLFLLSTVGVIVSTPFAFGIIGSGMTWGYYWVLLYVFLFGIAWDYLYNFLQQLMWDHDWPGLFQLASAIAEGLLLAGMIKFVGLPHIPQEFPLQWFALHYVLVWLATYLLSWVIMRLLFPHWRFRGGEWIGKW
ncbi:hypothetical protein ACQ4M3_37510 [Leptolyngbya sp. AN03gr2]|uniref:hypothetical protein n=1 Tax=unclassified Leptolyngbya TaxID=2650499 RepID=UPI003D31AD6C